MKRLQSIVFDATAARFELSLLATLLNSKPELKEREDILPFFSANNNISMLFSHYIGGIKTADRLASEFIIEGDFRIDLIVGDLKEGRYLLVEFEDARPNSIFAPGTKAYPDYAKRFEGAFSQIIDWMWRLDDARQTQSLKIFSLVATWSFKGSSSRVKT